MNQKVTAGRVGAAVLAGLAAGQAVGVAPMVLTEPNYLGYATILIVVSFPAGLGLAAGLVVTALGGRWWRAALASAVPGLALGTWYAVDQAGAEPVRDLILVDLYFAAISTAAGAVFGLIACRT